MQTLLTQIPAGLRLAPWVILLVMVPACTRFLPQGSTPHPTLVASRPAHGATDVAVDRNLVVRFTRPVPSTWLPEDNVTIDPPVACEFDWHPDNHLLTCDPVTALHANTTYQVTLSNVAHGGSATNGAPSGLVGADDSEPEAEAGSQTFEFTTQAEVGTFETSMLAGSMPMDGQWNVRHDYGQATLVFPQAMDISTVDLRLFDDFTLNPYGASAGMDVVCDNLAWNASATEVTCNFIEPQAGHYQLTLDPSHLGDQAPEGAMPVTLEWAALEATSLAETTFTGKYAFAASSSVTYDMLVSWSTVNEDGTVNGQAQFLYGGESIFRARSTRSYNPVLLTFTPDAVTTEGTFSGRVGALYPPGDPCGPYMRFTGTIGNTLQGTMQFDPADGPEKMPIGCPPLHLMDGSYDLKRSSNYVPLSPSNP